MNVVIAQKGAREHFVVARSLAARGMLAQVVTDWYPPFRLPPSLAARIPSRALRRALSGDARLPRKHIRAMNMRGLLSKLRLRAAGRGEPFYRAQLADDEAFARRVAALDMPPHDAFFGYSYASLEALQAETRRGRFTVVDQIDPGESLYRTALAEARKWPDWATGVTMPPEAYFARARAEWALADRIVVNSAWTKHCLLDEGVSEDKLVVIPLAYDGPQGGEPPTKAPCERGPLTVLWVGNVTLTKGIQYLVEAAGMLADEDVRFVVAGPRQVSERIIRDAPAGMEWLGQVPRAEVAQLYQSADVFVLPTLSDGFALTQLEALAHGLPVIVTPNCGHVVDDGHTGAIVPPADAEALAEAIRRFVHDRDLAQQMAPACMNRAKQFSTERYGERLAALF